MTSLEAREYIHSLINFELRPPRQRRKDIPSFDLTRIQQLLQRIGNPQEHLKVIHVAGSKGKGSTCVFTAHILRRAGYVVGLYTSPHMNDYRERIRVLGCVERSGGGQAQGLFPDQITEEEFCAALGDIKPRIDEMRAGPRTEDVSFFEVFTALALYHFHKKKVDWVVLETGMGGRLDATNVTSSLVCAITPISLEHTDCLGDTVGQIAGEKAGIIKASCRRVVVAPQEIQAREVINERCRALFIQPCWVGDDIRVEVTSRNQEKQGVCIETSRSRYSDLILPLTGDHQAVNAAVAVGIVEGLRELGFVISEEAVYGGFQETFWPGRLEVVGGLPLTVLDGAHNQASAWSLTQSLRKIFPGKAVTLILGVGADKDREGICREFNRIARTVIASQADHPRAYRFRADELLSLFAGKRLCRSENIRQALELAIRETNPEDMILVSGSLFLVSEARRLILNGLD